MWRPGRVGLLWCWASPASESRGSCSSSARSWPRKVIPSPPCYCSRRGSLSPLQPFGEVMGEVPATPQEAVAWVQDQAGPGPLLLVVEDAHWADPSTLEAVHVIARSDAHVLVVMSARPEIADDPHVQSDVQLTLDRLSSDECAACWNSCPRLRS